ncbi:hypothetical protein BDR03DRAFT_243234 [Suillus americanus]|nr:hypothetical protein BDR03DRAFT_243234 [Suillus americanus]
MLVQTLLPWTIFPRMITTEDDDYPEPAIDSARHEAQEPRNGLLGRPTTSMDRRCRTSTCHRCINLGDLFNLLDSAQHHDNAAQPDAPDDPWLKNNSQ